MCGARWTTMEISHQDWVMLARVHETVKDLAEVCPPKATRPSPFGVRRISVFKPALRQVRKKPLGSGDGG